MLRPLTQRPALFGCVLALGCMAVLTGCGHGPSVVHVKGKVAFKNGAMPNTQIKMIGFLPTNNTTAEIRKGASSMISTDGSYDLWTRKPDDGINVGEYDVTFTVQSGPMDPASLIPANYSSRATTPYKNIKIDKNADDLNFEIDMSGGGGTTGK